MRSLSSSLRVALMPSYSSPFAFELDTDVSVVTGIEHNLEHLGVVDLGLVAVGVKLVAF